MLICNTCEKTEEEVKISKKTMLCVSCYNKEYQKKNKEKLKEKRKEYYSGNKESIRVKHNTYRENNKESIKEYNRNYITEYQKCNKESIKERKKDYYENNKESIKVKINEYHIKNKEFVKEYKMWYYENNKEFIKVKSTEYYETNKNKEDFRINRMIYRENNKDKINKRQKERLNNDNLYKLTQYTRSMMNKAFNSINSKKNSKTSKILGCSFEEFKLHLESKFEDWMTWENYGKYNGELNYGWDIDHMMPLSSAVTEEDIYRLNHFTNLQPLCSYNNRYIKKDNF